MHHVSDYAPAETEVMFPNFSKLSKEYLFDNKQNSLC